MLNPGIGLWFFRQIVAGVAHAHAHQPPIYHLDLKPENILLRNDVPVVADFGICFIEDDQVSFTREGPRGSIYYCAPELRNPKISGDLRPAAADVYSLGKVLYRLFTGEVYDGHEEDYGNETNRHLAHLFPSQPEFAFVDQLVFETVRRNPTDRVKDAIILEQRVRELAERVDAGGRVLDLRIPQRYLYCAAGHYQPVCRLPDIAYRKNPNDPSRFAPLQGNRPGLYEDMNNVANRFISLPRDGHTVIPLLLICDHCGNVQYFRLDRTNNGGENWRP